MTPADLKAYLDVCRGAGLMSCHLSFPSGMTVAATFGPEPLETVGKALTEDIAPGEWKSWAKDDDK